MKSPTLFLFLFSMAAIPIFSQTSRHTESKNSFDSQYLEMLNGTLKNIEQVDDKMSRILFNARIANLLERFDQDRSNRIMTRAEREFLIWLKENEDVINSDFGRAQDESGDDFYFERGKIPIVPGGFSRKYEIVRSAGKLTLEIAYMDPFNAYEFYKKTKRVLDAGKDLYLWGNEDIPREIFRLMTEQDFDRASKIVREYVSNGDNKDSVEIMEMIYEANETEGGKLGNEYLEEWIKRDVLSKADFETTSELLNIGNKYLNELENKKVKSSIFSKKLLVKTAEKFANTLLAQNEIDKISEYQIEKYLESIRYFLPVKADVIEQKWREKNGTEDCSCAKNERRSSTDRLRDVDDAMSEAIEKAVADIKKSAEEAIYEIDPNANVKLSDAEKARVLKRKKDTDFVRSLSEFNKRNLSDVERLKFIKDAVKVIAGVRDKNKRVWLLTELAFNLNEPADKEIAEEIMEEAAKLVKSNPVTFYDFFYSARMVGGYSSFDINKSFYMLEQLVMELNKTANAGMKFTEVIGEDLPILGELSLTISDEMGESAFRTVGNADGTLVRFTLMTSHD
ncbi:MAG: hypothetical protein R2681_02905 [Pyrinomonadaceae bacterium]